MTKVPSFYSSGRHSRLMVTGRISYMGCNPVTAHDLLETRIVMGLKYMNEIMISNPLVTDAPIDLNLKGFILDFYLISIFKVFLPHLSFTLIIDVLPQSIHIALSILVWLMVDTLTEIDILILR